MQARFYLPMYGRFASPDPARDQRFENTQTWNIYSYCANDPIDMTDPTGLAPNKAGITNPSHVREALAKNPSLAGLRDTHGSNKDRYFYTDKYGWVDVRHFAEASRRVSEEGQWQVTVRTLGVLVEISQWASEWGDDYRSGFSPQDIPSNDAGANFGGYIQPGESLADAFDRWIKDAGGRNIDDESVNTRVLPATDPSVKGGNNRGSNASSTPVNPGENTANTSNASTSNSTPPPPPKPKKPKKESSESNSES